MLNNALRKTITHREVNIYNVLGGGGEYNVNKHKKQQNFSAL
jgi:hypothetical protein